MRQLWGEFSGNKRSHLLIANAPHSARVWQAIDASGISIHSDSLQKLQEYQDSTSSRKFVIDSLVRYRLQKALNYGEMLYYVAIDTALSVEEVKDSLKDETELQLRLLLADLHMADGEYSNAGVIYETEKLYYKENKDLKTLRGMQIGLFANGKTYYDIGTMGYEFEDDLDSLAFGNDTSIASFQAMAILELIRDTIYPRPIRLDTSGSGGSSKRSLEEAMQNYEALRQYRLIPTVIKGEMAGYVELGAEEEGELKLYDLYGRYLQSFPLQPGTNTVPVGAFMQSEGVYVYRVLVNHIVKRSDKIIKIRNR